MREGRKQTSQQIKNRRSKDEGRDELNCVHVINTCYSSFIFKYFSV